MVLPTIYYSDSIANNIRRKIIMNEPTIKEMIDKTRNLNFDLNEVNPYKDEKGHTTSKDKAVTYSLTKRAKKYIKDPDIKVPQRGTVKNGKVSAKFGMNTGSAAKQCGRLTIDGEEKTPTRSCKDYPKDYQESQVEDVADYLLVEPDMPPEDIPENSATHDEEMPIEIPRKGIRVKMGEKKREKKRKESEVRRKERIFPGYDSRRRLAKGITEDLNQDIEVELDDIIASLKVFLKTADQASKTEFYSKMESLGLISNDRAIDYCKKKGLKTFEDFLKLQNSMIASQKGDLFKKDK